MSERQAHRYAIRLHTVSVVCEHFTPESIEGKHADQPAIAAGLVLDLLQTRDQDAETFGILALDGRHRVTGFKFLTQGTATQAPVDGGKLFRTALHLDARGVLLFHNHPSGDLQPSRDDLDLTRRLVMAGQIVGIPVHDHIICALGRWISLRSGRPELFANATTGDITETLKLKEG
jgi:DNA repair protein RadC